VLLTPEILAWARGHHGLVTLAAWQSLGRSESSYYRAARAGLLVPVAPRVAAIAGRVVGDHERIAAGVLSFGPEVVASHRSAAALWGAPVPGAAPVDLITRTRTNRTAVAGYSLHRPVDRRGLHAVRRAGLPVTSPLRTLLDVGAVSPAHVEPLLETLVRRGLVSPSSVQSAIARHRRRGRPGIGPLVRALEAAATHSTVADSELERRMLAIFARAGMHDWTMHAVIEGYEVDFAFAFERVVVEVDGWVFHGADRTRWERDRARDLTLAAQGWLVIRLTWRLVTRQPAAAAARLHAALRSRRPAA